jgi:hypothetical protein
MLAQALPGAAIYPSAHATVEMLGAVRLSFEDEVTIETFRGIIGNTRPAPTPVGGRLFGETRIVIGV